MTTAAKVVIVTGANSGIGYHIVKSLLQSDRHYHIFVGSRSREKADLAIVSLQNDCPSSNSELHALAVDLDTDESISHAYDQVRTDVGRVDVLINNAGATFDIAYVDGQVSLRDCFNKAYNVNVAGTNVMTHVFMPLLLKSSDPRLIFVAGLSNITTAAEKYFPTPPLPAGWPKKVDFETIGYRCSKTALNMLMLDWNHKLTADGVKVWGVGPGMVATNLGGRGPEWAKAYGAGDPSVSGDTLRRVVEGERDAEVGKLINRQGLSAW